MNRRKFLSHIAKGSAGIAATAVLGTTIIDALIPEKTNLGADGTFNSATLIKGHQHLKVGYVYAPYIPVLKTPLINNEYTVSKGMMQKYANKLVNTNFYGTNKFDNLF